MTAELVEAQNGEEILVYTPAEVASKFRVDPKTVGTWARQGKLPFIRLPNGYRRYPVAVIDELLVPRTEGDIFSGKD